MATKPHPSEHPYYLPAIRTAARMLNMAVIGPGPELPAVDMNPELPAMGPEARIALVRRVVLALLDAYDSGQAAEYVRESEARRGN